MPRLWGSSRWGSFRWGGSEAFNTLLDQKSGVTPARRIIWELDGGDEDITAYFLGAGAIHREKERAPDRISAGDATLTFSNATDVFTETDTGSILYGEKYHNRNITFEVGFELPDGTYEYVKVATMKVRSVTLSSDRSRCTIRVYDQIRRLLTETINRKPESMVPVAGGSNVGDGTCSDVAIKPFTTVAENWTLTCTLAGSSAEFSVVGSVSGNIGTATIGTEFATGGVKFTINGGDADFALNDVFTFSTVLMMQFNAVNPVKIIWALLTGTNWDDGVAYAWQSRTPELDSTRNNSNPDINYQAFSSAVDNVSLTLKGFIPWDADLIAELEQIAMHFLGASTVDGSGRFYVKSWRPELSLEREFSDEKKNISMTVVRDVQDMVNWANVTYKRTDVWPWSDEDIEDSLDGLYVAKNQTSHDDYGQWFTMNLESRWYSAAGDHVEYLASRIVDKYGQPPRRFEWRTGLDGLEIELGDVVQVTDEKAGYSQYPVEVMKKEGDFGRTPHTVYFEAEDTGTIGINWVFLGSSADEGDGISPQASDFDSATAVDKQFCYLSQTGGSGSATGPDYYIF